MRVRRSEKITISVPLVLVGDSIGVKEGGVLSQSLNQIEISCFPTDVPEQVELNIEDLELNSAKSVADLEIDIEDLDIVTDPSLNIVSITPPASEEKDVKDVEGVEEGDEPLEETSKSEGDNSSDGENSGQSENS
jgi:large subunit ribosomal protein L25